MSEAKPTALLPCPFCGGPAFEETINDICCADKKCVGSLAMGSRDDWNTRTHSPAQAEWLPRELVVLREYIERLERHVTLAAAFVPDHKDALHQSDEEKQVLERLRGEQQ